MEVAQGDYIAFLDADDKWSRNKIETTIAAIEAYPNYEIGIIFTDLDRYDLNARMKLPKTNNQIYPYLHRFALMVNEPFYYLPQENLFELLLKKYDVFPSTLVISRSILGKIEWPAGRHLCEDFAFNIRCSRITNAVYVNQPLSHLLRHDNNISINYKSLADEDIKVLDDFLQNEELTNSEVKRVMHYYGNRFCGRGYSMRIDRKYRKAIDFYIRALKYPNTSLKVVKGLILTALSSIFSILR
jgi:glycosyltransferase involved in cell wall biosynthesis